MCARKVHSANRALIVLGIVICSVCMVQSALRADETPVMHLRKTSTPPPILTMLQGPAEASAWYPSSPTWFGMGGKTGDRNHTEVLATYDDSALYVAFMNIDRSTELYPRNTSTDITLVDSNAVWIETPQGRRFYFLAAIDTNYPPRPVQASGEFPNYDGKTDSLGGWSHSGWYAGDKTLQQTVKIPWSAMSASAPASGSRWRVNFVNYNQTSSTLSSSTVRRQLWSMGDETDPAGWGILAFDEAAFAPPAGISPEATLTLRPASGFGEEITLRAGNAADLSNEWTGEAITQSNWNDWDPIDYTIKEYVQFDLSMIPTGRKIISATFQNHFRGHFESSPTELYLHVVRLAGPYDPASVTMLTSPAPVENGYRRLVRTTEVGNWIDFDVTDAVTKSLENGSSKVSFALAGSSGDIHNGKIWNVSFGRADYYDKRRPRLIITFGTPGVSYPSPVSVGSLNYQSVATASSKNKLTNGTFRYGTVEGITNTTYWHADPGAIYVNGQNVILMRLAGDINPNTGNPALRFMTVANWKWIRQIATGLIGGKTYTFSGWYKGSASGIKSDVRMEFQDANGNALGSGQAVYSGSGSWEKVKLTKTAPSGTTQAKIELVNWTSGTGTYMLYSDLQLEEGSTATTYSETMGVYYPDHPRADGSISYTAGNCIAANERQPLGSAVGLVDRIVTGAYPGYFYIQCPEEGHIACGIKVLSSAAPVTGSLVSLSGTLDKDSNDELVIDSGFAATTSSQISQGATTVVPVFGCKNNDVCGGTQDNLVGPTGGTGINTVGVLQVTWGRVSELIAGVSMMIDDGSGAPVKVIGPTGSAANGGFVRVTGIASIQKIGGMHIRVLRTRSADDVRVIGG